MHSTREDHRLFGEYSKQIEASMRKEIDAITKASPLAAPRDRAAYYQAMAQEAAAMQAEAAKLNLELPRDKPVLVLHRPTQIHLVTPPVGMRDPMTFWRSLFVCLFIIGMGGLLGYVIVDAVQIWAAMRGWL